MARYQLTAAHELTNSDGRRQHYRAGTVICDGVGCHPNDVVIPNLNLITKKQPVGSGFAGTITGADSIQP